MKKFAQTIFEYGVIALASLLSVLAVISVFALLIIGPAVQAFIGAVLISLPVWFAAWWILFWSNSSYLPASWWDGYWLCVLSLFIVGVLRTLFVSRRSE